MPPDLKSSVYHFGVVTGGEKEWDFVYDQFKSTDVVSDKLILLQAMAGSQEPWIIERQDSVIDSQFLEKTDGLIYLISWQFRSTFKRWRRWVFSSQRFINRLRKSSDRLNLKQTSSCSISSTSRWSWSQRQLGKNDSTVTLQIVTQRNKVNITNNVIYLTTRRAAVCGVFEAMFTVSGNIDQFWLAEKRA